jgi:tetrapyrrole methylase family protein/MazG family protein
MRILRSPQGCPWDHKQTLSSLKDHLVEESHEVLDAIDSGDRRKLCDELGDLLLQVVFQSQLCAEEGAFTLNDVATSIVEKLIRRHPHVFGATSVSGADEVLKNWEQIKKTEKGETPRSTLDGIPRSLPGLQKAHLVQKRAARVGFDWDNAAGALAKLGEEVAEIQQAAEQGDPTRVGEEVGDLLFAAVNVCRFFEQNPEAVLQDTIGRFTARFRYIEDRVHEQGRQVSDLPLAELDRLWDQAKQAGL